MDLLTSTNSELQFSLVGCQYVDKGNVCGEKDSLAIIVEMQKMYEEKMSILDREGGGDYEALQAKNRLQEMWIKDLIQQSKMLISAIQELEREATERVRLLEQRIKKNSHTGTEVMSKYRDLDIRYNISETYQSVIYLQSDIHNLVKIIKQFQNDGVWSSEGFHFYFVNSDDLKFDAQRAIVNMILFRITLCLLV
ncbi:uncharacterized protein LOC112905254 [Agrilus planipennis]|uniref:Uncharacterized protein LOC112905254 n=1 Tax=Agrilus planipennis TaxID=224129 RepID=A0A7F5RAV1_AGRPL|nr:uncharacterized protein LOC112905254 [Agrilus planipennis]